MISSSLTSPIGWLATVLPLRNTVTLSATCRTSASRCEMKMTSIPDRDSVRDRSSSHSVSRGAQRRRGFVEDQHGGIARKRLGDLDDLALGQGQPPYLEVGARRGHAEALEEFRRLLPELRLADGVEAAKAARAGTRCSARRSDRGRATAPGTPPRCRPHAPDAGCRRERALRSRRILPASGRTEPARIWMKVLFPAPFSPSSACTSPERAWKFAPLSAATPPKRFETEEA